MAIETHQGTQFFSFPFTPCILYTLLLSFSFLSCLHPHLLCHGFLYESDIILFIPLYYSRRYIHIYNFYYSCHDICGLWDILGYTTFLFFLFLAMSASYWTPARLTAGYAPSAPGWSTFRCCLCRSVLWTH